MKCPSCDYESSRVQLKCGRCETTYTRADLERLHHLDYLLNWLDEHDETLKLAKFLELRHDVLGQREALLGTLLPRQAEPKPVGGEQSSVFSEQFSVSGEMPPVAATLPETETLPTAEPSITPPPPRSSSKLRKRPSLNWSGLWDKLVEAAVSGLLLRGLLYLGAFMIIVSLTILVVRFWDAFPKVAQLGFIAAVPTTFYAAGWWVRHKLELIQAGGVLVGIGAVLVAVDFAAVYQFSGLAGRIDPARYWLLTSIVCTAVYTLTAWRYPIEFFGYITLLAFSSSLAALAVGLPLGWIFTAVTLSALLMLPLAWVVPRTNKRWHELGRAAGRLPFLLLLFTISGSLYGLNHAYWGGTLSLLLAAVTICGLGWLHRESRLILVGVGLFILPYSLAFYRIFILLEMTQPIGWLMVAWSGLSLIFLLLSLPLQHSQSTIHNPQFIIKQLPYGTAVWLTIWAHILVWASVIGLLPATVIDRGVWTSVPILMTLAGVMGLYLLSAVLHHNGRYPIISHSLNKDFPGWLARSFYQWPLAGLIPLWISIAWLAWLPRWYDERLAIILAGLGFIFVGLGQVLARYDKTYRLPWHTAVYPLLLTAFAVAFFNSDDGVWLGTLLLAVVCLGGLSAVYQRKLESFVAIPLFIATFQLAYELLPFPATTMPVAYGVLAMACLLTARLLAQTNEGGWQQVYRQPMQAATGIIWGWSLLLTNSVGILKGYSWISAEPTILTQLIGVITLILAARLYRSRWPLYLVPWLLFWPVTLFFAAHGEAALGRPLTAPEYSLVWLGLASLTLLAAFWLDKSLRRYAHGLYLGGYGLLSLAVAWGWPDEFVSTIVLGAAILIALVSQWLVHTGQHYTYAELFFILWQKPYDLISRLFRVGFLFLAAYAFPIWLVRLVLWRSVDMAWLGLGLTLTAVLYVTLGVMMKQTRREYGWPMFSAGYALTAVAPLLTILTMDVQMIIVVLSMIAGLYFVSALIFRQAGWLYLANGLLPIVTLLVMADNGLLTWARGTVALMALACLYVGLGRLLDGGRRPLPHLSPFAWPFYIYGYGLSLLALGAAVSIYDSRFLLQVTLAGAALYGVSAWAFRTAYFLYPALFLGTVSYGLGVSLTAVSSSWLGLTWLPLLIIYLAVGEIAFAGSKIQKRRINPAEWEMPFFLAAYALSVLMIGQSWGTPLPRTVALAAAALLYFESAIMFNSWVWLYPALLAVHVALASYFTINSSGGGVYLLAYPFMALTWLLTMVGYVLWQRGIGDWRLGDRANLQSLISNLLIKPSWAQPFLLFAALDVIVWQVVSSLDWGTAVIIALGHALLLGLLAHLWRAKWLHYASLFFGILAVGYFLLSLPLPVSKKVAVVSGIGFGLYILGMLLSYLPRLIVWQRPLRHMGAAVTTIAAVVSLTFIFWQPGWTAVTLIFSGLLYLTAAVRQQHHLLGYGGVGLLLSAWILLLLDWGFRQPQWIAIPLGLYLVGVAVLERQRKQAFYATYLEAFGLVVILLTSFIQSLNGLDGFPYFILLMAESLLLIGWTAVRRVKIPFFIGIFFCVLNVLAQVIVLVNVLDISRWVVVLAVGLALVSTAVFVERKQEQIRSQSKLWREALEMWQ
ncbi:MAG: hypothetical protein GY796_03730 [Chloroflexi bacterium]|nr:hypothetical protein [Chloroflexota bacterium]